MLWNLGETVSLSKNILNISWRTPVQTPHHHRVGQPRNSWRPRPHQQMLQNHVIDQWYLTYMAYVPIKNPSKTLLHWPRNFSKTFPYFHSYIFRLEQRRVTSLENFWRVLDEEWTRWGQARVLAALTPNRTDFRSIKMRFWWENVLAVILDLTIARSWFVAIRKCGKQTI